MTTHQNNSISDVHAQKNKESPAEIYDDMFVPTFFGRFTGLTLDAARVDRGHTVMDVGCGTGALAVAAAGRVGPEGNVAGLDPNEEMLEQARLKDVPIDWHQGPAEQIPFEDETFDSVVSQFSLMYFDDKPKALQEMHRVLKPGGKFAVLVPDAIDRSPGFSVATELLHRLFGEEVARGMREPFQDGDPDYLKAICDDAGLRNAEITRATGAGRFDTPSDFMKVEGSCAWTLGGLLNDEQLNQLYKESNQAFKPFQHSDGSIMIETPSLIIQATKS